MERLHGDVLLSKHPTNQNSILLNRNYGDSLLNALIKLVSVMHDSTYFALFTNPVYVCL